MTAFQEVNRAIDQKFHLGSKNLILGISLVDWEPLHDYVGREPNGKRSALISASSREDRSKYLRFLVEASLATQKEMDFTVIGRRQEWERVPGIELHDATQEDVVALFDELSHRKYEDSLENRRMLVIDEWRGLPPDAQHALQALLDHVPKTIYIVAASVEPDRAVDLMVTGVLNGASQIVQEPNGNTYWVPGA